MKHANKQEPVTDSQEEKKHSESRMVVARGPEEWGVVV